MSELCELLGKLKARREFIDSLRDTESRKQHIKTIDETIKVLNKTIKAMEEE